MLALANVLINGLKSTGGGGEVILNNYLALLNICRNSNRYVVLVPSESRYWQYASNRISIVSAKDIWKRNVSFPILYGSIIPTILKRYRIDSIFNFGDVVFRTRVPQLYLFDWPYAVYPDSVVWDRMDLRSYLYRKIKLAMFKRNLRWATIVIAQTTAIKKRLEALHGLKNVVVIPNAVSLDNVSGGRAFDFNLPKEKIKLLYLTYYYTHKNLEIFIPLALEIRKRKLDYLIVTTLEEDQHAKAKAFLMAIRQYDLGGIIQNIGHVQMEHVPSLYRQIDGMLMPTLLESYGLPYVEAMFHNVPILTSDLDFARVVCGDAGFYFNPLDVDDILNSIKLAFENERLKNKKREAGRIRVERLANWQQVFVQYQELLNGMSSLE